MKYSAIASTLNLSWINLEDDRTCADYIQKESYAYVELDNDNEYIYSKWLINTISIFVLSAVLTVLLDDVVVILNIIA